MKTASAEDHHLDGHRHARRRLSVLRRQRRGRHQRDRHVARRADQEHQGQRSENIGLLEQGQWTSRWSRASRPTKPSPASAARRPRLKIISAIYSNPGMFAVRGDSPAKTLRDLIGKPIAWGTQRVGADAARALRHRRARARPREGFRAALSGKGRRRPGDGGGRPGRGALGRRHRLAGFTAIVKAGGRFVGLTPDESREGAAPSTTSSRPSRFRPALTKVRQRR